MKITSRSQVKVKWFTLEVHARSISPEPFDQFSWNFTHMVLLVTRCAEHMTQLPRLKVTGQGQRIYPWISCPLHISWTLELVSLNFIQMFLLVRQCAKHMTQPHWLKVTGRGQGIYPYLLYPEVNFSWNSLSETMCRIFEFATKTQGQGHTLRSCLYPSIFVGSISSDPLERF